MSTPDKEPVILDFLGREIKGGDMIVYPIRRGSKLWMQKIRVIGVTPGPRPQIHGYNDVGRKITVRNIKNVVIITSEDSQ